MEGGRWDDDTLRMATERLELIPVTREHTPEMFDVLSDVALYRYTGELPPLSLDALAKRFEYLERRRSPDGKEMWLNWVLQQRESGALIGLLQAGIGPGYADLAWIVGRRWQGNGYAKEVLRALVERLDDIDRTRPPGPIELRASINPIHAASIAVAESVGLRRTDRVKEHELLWVRPAGE